ncbi:MAG: glycosyltransferase [Candidatus Latescibacterota bacterium]
MPTVAHCTALYLHAAGSWIHAQIAFLRRYRPVVLAQDTANLEQFPAPRLHAAAAWPAPRRLANRLLRRATGHYPFYAALLRTEGACLIHAHFGPEGARCLGARKGSGLPLLTSFYGADATQYARLPRWQRAYRHLFAVGEAFAVEGNCMRQQLASIGCPPERIHVHHLGVDLERIPFAPPCPGEEVRFLICAGLKEKKGVQYALRALSLAHRQRPFPHHLVVIGDGPDRSHLERLVQELGMGQRVEFRGMQPYESVLRELRHSHVLLQPSVTAADGDTEGGAPVILLDAQAAGLPVVATRHADIPEYVLDGVSGLLVPERDVEALADAIGRLAGAPERWAGMGAAGRAHVEAHYNAVVQAERLETLYDEVAG